MEAPPPTPFGETLARHGLELLRGDCRTLQVNVGLVCDRACRHCHLDAGPQRREVMGRTTMDQVIAFAARGGFAAIDVTGGAPELVPDLEHLLTSVAGLAPRLILRSNLTALALREGSGLPQLCRELGVTIVTSLPSLNIAQAEAQRGTGTLATAIAMLRRLNALGYGREGSGLELDLVVNPTGAFLPPSQCGLEKRFRSELARRHGIAFNHLYTFANVPLGRFRRWLESSGNLAGYLEKLAAGFNPATVPGLMCRTQLSVAWDGYLYDCDFNLATGQGLAGGRRHVTELCAPPAAGSPVATGDHCYACTAGTGFT